MSRTPGAAIAVVALLPVAAHAYRPFNGTDADTARRGEVELELAPLGFERDGPDRFLVAPGIVANWGFAEEWELVLEGRHFVQLGNRIALPRFRVEDAAVSVKHVLRDGSLQDKGGISLATEIGALLPTIHDEPGIGAQAAVIASERWPALTVHLNLATALTRAHDFGLFAGAIVEGPGSWRLRPVAELFVETESSLPAVVSGLVGARWPVREGLTLDGGLRVASAGGVNTVEVRAGLTWTFGLGVPK